VDNPKFFWKNEKEQKDRNRTIVCTAVASVHLCFLCIIIGYRTERPAGNNQHLAKPSQRYILFHFDEHAKKKNGKENNENHSSDYSAIEY
jgi:hypothetical protein